MYNKKGEDLSIRRVKVLGGRAREQARDEGYDEDDIVLVKETIASLPKYEFIKVEGSPTEFLKKQMYAE